MQIFSTITRSQEYPFDFYDKYFNIGDTVYVKSYGYSGGGNIESYTTLILVIIFILTITARQVKPDIL